MRKTSQDGGDTSSITSGVENETKKTVGILKSKKNSIKRKVQSLSHESDDAAIEPLLQKDMEKTDLTKQSAKYDLLSKTKTESTSEMGNEKERLLHSDKTQISILSDTRNVGDTFKPMPSTSKLTKPSSGAAPLHNHMNTNVFSNHDAIKGVITTKSQIFVEIDSSKQSGYNPSPLIFTTAKIHTDGKNKNMEPLQVTPVPILSTIEVSVLKGTSINNIAEKYGNTATSSTNIADREKSSKLTAPELITTSNKMIDKKALNTTEKQSVCSAMPTKDKKDIKTESIAMKDFNIASISDRDYDLKGNKKAENISVNTESKKGGQQTKLSLSQSISLSSTTTSGSAEGVITATTSKKSSTIIQANKDNVGGKLNRQELSKLDALNMTEPEPNMDVNKNITPPSHFTLKDKVSVNAMFTGAKQLQRQKTAIDKDDTKTLKTSLDSSSLSYNATSTRAKPVGCDESRFNDKTKLPISTANNVQKTSYFATTSTKPSSTVSKSTIADAIPSTKSIFTNQSTAVTVSITPVPKTADIAISSALPSTSVAKQQSSIMTTAKDANNKDISSANTPISTTVTKKDSMSATGTPCSTSKHLNAKPIATHHETNATFTKPMPQAKVKKSTDINAKLASTSINTAKSPPATISTTKTPPASAGAVKSLPVTTITTKIPPATTSTAKHSAIATTIAKSSIASSSAANFIPVTANVASSMSATANTAPAKSLPTEITTAKSASVVTSTVKSLPVTTITAKSQPPSTSTAKSQPESTSTAKSQPAENTTSKSSSVVISNVKSLPVTTITAKSQSPSTSTAKSQPAEITTSKSSSVVTSTVKSLPVTTITAKSQPQSTSTAKNQPESTSIVKSQPAEITTSKSSSVTSNVKSLPVTTITAKSQPPSTSTAKSPPTSISTAKCSTKTLSLSTTTVPKLSTAKSSTTPTSKSEIVSHVPSSTAADAVSTVTSGMTSKSAVSNKKAEAKSTELSNGKKI